MPLQVVRALGLVAGLGVASIVVMAIGRAIQTPQARALLQRYEEAATEPLPSGPIFDSPGPGTRVQQAMLAVETSCVQPVVVTVHYLATQDHDFTRLMTLPAKARAFVPVYAMDEPRGEPSRFAGVEGPACIHVSRVRCIDQLLWVDATLAPGWREAPLHQRVYIGAAFPERIWLKIAQWWPSFAALG